MESFENWHEHSPLEPQELSFLYNCYLMPLNPKTLDANFPAGWQGMGRNGQRNGREWAEGAGARGQCGYLHGLLGAQPEALGRLLHKWVFFFCMAMAAVDHSSGNAAAEQRQSS